MKLAPPAFLCALLATACSHHSSGGPPASTAEPPVRSLSAYWPLDALRTWTFTEGHRINYSVGLLGPAIYMYPPLPASFLDIDGEKFVLGSELSEWSTVYLRRIPDQPLPMLEDPLVPGTELLAEDGYSERHYFNTSQKPFDQGRIQSRSRIEGPFEVTVPLGTYEEVLLWDLELGWIDGNGVPGQRRWRFWLAPNNGPVQIQFDDGPIYGLVRRSGDRR